MKTDRLVAAIAAALLLAACTTTSTRDRAAQVSAAVTLAGTGAPQSPATSDPYPDASELAAPLTPQHAVQFALRNNPRVRAELAGLDVAEADHLQAGLLANPMASLMALRPDGGGGLKLDYGLMQDLFDVVTRARRVAVADAAQDRTDAEIAARLAGLVQDTEAAYYAALAAQSRLSIKRDQRDLAQQALDLMQRQAHSGSRPATTMLQQEVIAAMREHDVGTTQAEAERARAELARDLGLSSAKTLVLPNTLPDLDLPGLDTATLQALAINHRPDLAAAAAQVDQARGERALQTGGWRATEPAAGPAGMRESSGMRFAGAALRVTLPIFDTGRARREKADAQLAQAGFMQEAVVRQIPLDVERSLATLAAARIAVEHASHHVRQQRQLEELAARNYAAGETDLLATLDVRQARLAAELDQLDAQQACWAAWVDLERATGIALTN